MAPNPPTAAEYHTFVEERIPRSRRTYTVAAIVGSIAITVVVASAFLANPDLRSSSVAVRKAVSPALLRQQHVSSSSFRAPRPLARKPSNHVRRSQLNVNAVPEINDIVGTLQANKDIVEHAAVASKAVAADTITPQLFASLADAVQVVSEQEKSVGPFGQFVKLIAGTILFMSNSLQKVGVEQSIGLSIVLFTVFVKLLTFPLNEQQIKGTERMGIIQPKIKEIQAKYKDDPNKSAEKLQSVYAENQVNPLAGLLPAFAQIPIFIALYRALQNLATDGQMNQPFLWLPNLEGPTFGPIGTNWLFTGFHDGVPQYGWHDTAAYLSLPIFLIFSQIVSQRLLVSKEQYDAQPQWTKFLPIIFGYFSLNVPSGLAVYWVANNIVTTGTNIALKQKFKNDPEVVALRERISKVDAPVEKPKPYVKPKEIVEESATVGMASEQSQQPVASSRGKSEPPKKRKKKKGKRSKKAAAVRA
mmetsp:Transcript_12754/g.17833  ORF Transcript_12754/g.17833 Transcript_12754/m.17833 type:complete len:473 (+) Transcript_12754:2-1420(+)